MSQRARCGDRSRAALLSHDAAVKLSFKGPRLVCTLSSVALLMALTLPFSPATAQAVGSDVQTVEPGIPEGTPAASDLEPPLPEVPDPLPEVVARVNGQGISSAELERAVREVEAQAGRPVPAENRSAIYRSVLDQLVGYHLLAQESESRGITIAEVEVQERVDKVRQQYPTQEAFEQALAEQSMTAEALHEEARTDMRISRMVETELGDSIAVTEADIGTFYQQNPDEFNELESVRARHILVGVEAEADETRRAQQRVVAETIRRKALAGEDFPTLAQNHSRDRVSAGNGGDLGFFVRGDTAPEFEAVAFALAPGEISDVVETPYGFQIIKVEEHRPARIVPLAEASEQIGRYLLDRAREAETSRFIDRLKTKGQVEIVF